MIEQEAVVVRVEGNQAFVKTGGAGTGCGRCHETGGCQSGLLGQLFCSQPRQYRIANSIGVVPGERVIVRIADGATLRAAILAYGLPVITLLLGALIGAAQIGADRNDTATALGAAIGMAMGILCGVLVRSTPLFKLAAPMLVRRGSNSCVAKDVC